MEQKDWIILAVVCGVIVIVMQQQQKPALVLPSVKQENFTEPDLETQLFLLHARIFALERPKYERRIQEWIRSMVSPKKRRGVFSIHPEQLKIADENHRLYFDNFRAAGFRD